MSTFKLFPIGKIYQLHLCMVNPFPYVKFQIHNFVNIYSRHNNYLERLSCWEKKKTSLSEKISKY